MTEENRTYVLGSAVEIVEICGSLKKGVTRANIVG